VKRNDKEIIERDHLGDPRDDETLQSWRMMKFMCNSVLVGAGYEKRQQLINGNVIDRVRTAFDIFDTCTTDEVVELVRCTEEEVIPALEELAGLGEIFIGPFDYNIGLPESERIRIWARDEPSLVDFKTDIVQ
jgi:hypothetical protein